MKARFQMPLPDQTWHYDGPVYSKGKLRALNVWLASDLQGDALQAAIIPSFMLALADGGYGGATIKALYDDARAKDEKLPKGAPDPYLNRHQLAGALASLLKT